MQRWFFLEERKKPKIKQTRKMSIKPSKPAPEVLSQLWVFSVTVPELAAREKVYITGSTPELGVWDYRRMIALEYEPSTNSWSKTITIPNTCDVYYRYVIGVPIENTEMVVVRYWEVHIKPRLIKETLLHPTVDSFGDLNGKHKVSRGWLTDQTLLQFKFTNNPLKLKSRLAERLLNIKVTPVKLSFGPGPAVDESSMSTDTLDVDVPPGVWVEVATHNNDPSLCTLQVQEQFGREYKPNDVLLINVLAPDHKMLAYLVDLYSYSSRASSEDPPCHVGYTYILPNMFKPSEGALELPVTCNVKHRPLGTVNIEYVIIRPMEEQLCNLQVSYSKYWNPSWTGLEVGHRGLGASFKTKE